MPKRTKFEHLQVQSWSWSEIWCHGQRSCEAQNQSSIAWAWKGAFIHRCFVCTIANFIISTTNGKMRHLLIWWICLHPSLALNGVLRVIFSDSHLRDLLSLNHELHHPNAWKLPAENLSSYPRKKRGTRSPRTKSTLTIRGLHLRYVQNDIWVAWWRFEVLERISSRAASSASWNKIKTKKKTLMGSLNLIGVKFWKAFVCRQRTLMSKRWIGSTNVHNFASWGWRAQISPDFDMVEHRLKTFGQINRWNSVLLNKKR